MEVALLALAKPLLNVHFCQFDFKLTQVSHPGNKMAFTIFGDKLAYTLSKIYWWFEMFC